MAEEDLENTLVEMPSFVLALVMIFFLVLTMGIDWLITYLRGKFQRSGRQGLANALDKVVTELTLLGFVSVILLVIQGSIGKVCIPYSPSLYGYTIISNIGSECPCCLGKTMGISECTQAFQNCGFNITEDTQEPYCGCRVPGAEYSSYPPPTTTTSSSGNETTATTTEDGQCSAIESTTLESCAGPFYKGVCGEGKFAAVSLKGLDQVHLLIFYVALFHVIITLFVMLGAGLRIRQWKMWENALLKGTIKASHLDEIEYVLSKAPSKPLPTAISAAPATVGVESGGMTSTDGGDSIPQENTDRSVETIGYIKDLENAPDEASTQLERTGTGWKRRGRLTGPVDWLKEGLICFIKSLTPNLVWRHHFFLLRTVYIEDQKLSADYRYLPDLVQQLDFNIADVAGVCWEMWIILTVVMLLMGAQSEILGIVMFIGVFLLVVSNFVLVLMVRHECRLDRPRQLRPIQSKWKDPKIISILLRSVIFMISLPFSFTLFLIIEYGPYSCLFNAGVFPFVAGQAPWWSALIFSGVLLIWLALVTVPAWTLVCASVDREGHAFTEDELCYTSEKVTEEIAKLQKLQRRLV